MRRLAVVKLLVVLLCLTAAFASAAEADLQALLTDLAGSNFVKSTAATKELVAMGPEVVPHIAAEILTSSDWSARFRGITVLRQLEAVEGVPHLLLMQSRP